MLLSPQGRTNVWSLEYGVGSAPTSFTSLGSWTTPDVWGATSTNFSSTLFGTNLNNLASLVFRISSPAASTGSGSRDTIAIDNFVINTQGGPSGSGTLGITEAGTATFSGNIVNNNAATFTAVTNGLATFSGNISGAGALTKTGAGTVTLSGNNSFSGGVTATAGVLRAATNTALGTGAVTVSNGASLVGTAGVTLTNGITIGDGGATLGILEAGTAIFSNTITIGSAETNNAATLTAALSDSIADFTMATFAGVGSNNILLTGLGQVKLGAGPAPAVDFNTFAGTFDASRGGGFTVAANTTNTSAKFNLASNSVIEFAGNTTASGKITVATGSTGRLSVASNATVTYSGELSKDGSTLVLAGGTHVVNGSITGTNANSDLVVSNSTVTLNSANSYNGPTFVVAGGTLNNGTNNALPTDTALTLGQSNETSATTNRYNLNGFDQTVASVTGVGGGVNVVTNSTGTNNLTLNSSVAKTISGLTMGGSGLTLTKAGANTVTLSGNASNSIAPGTIAIQQGTLLLAGDHQIDNSTGINLAGGTLDTGGVADSVGTLSITANSSIKGMNANGGSNFLFSDIDMSTYSGGAGAVLTFLGSYGYGSVINLVAKDITGYANFNNFESKIQFGNPGLFGQLNFNSGLGFTTLTAIPEPRVYVGAAILALLIGLTEYRRRRKSLVVKDSLIKA